jgi:hypothetical protein
LGFTCARPFDPYPPMTGDFLLALARQRRQWPSCRSRPVAHAFQVEPLDAIKLDIVIGCDWLVMASRWCRRRV